MDAYLNLSFTSRPIYPPPPTQKITTVPTEQEGRWAWEVVEMLRCGEEKNSGGLPGAGSLVTIWQMWAIPSPNKNNGDKQQTYWKGTG
jgi:hypothetical protein